MGIAKLQRGFQRVFAEDVGHQVRAAALGLGPEELQRGGVVVTVIGLGAGLDAGAGRRRARERDGENRNGGETREASHADTPPWTTSTRAAHGGTLGVDPECRMNGGQSGD